MSGRHHTKMKYSAEETNQSSEIRQAPTLLINMHMGFYRMWRDTGPHLHDAHIQFLNSIKFSR